MMISRRDALGSLPLAMFVELATSAANARGQAPPPGPNAVFTHDLPNLTMDDWQVTVSYVDYPPGRVGNPHRHPGFVLAYVLEGAVVTRVSGQDERTYGVGQMFFEPPGSIHEVSSNASQTQPARLLAMIFAKKGLPLTASAKNNLRQEAAALTAD